MTLIRGEGIGFGWKVARFALASVAAWSFWGTAACGDELLIDSGDRKVGRIVGFHNGEVELDVRGGPAEKIAVWKIELIIVDSTGGLDYFNEAERQLLKGQPKESIPRYSGVLRTARGYWRDLIRARMLIASDEAELFEQAIESFLLVAQSDVSLAAQLLPQTMPSQPSRTVERVQRALEKSKKSLRSQSELQLVELLQYRLMCSLGDASAKKMTRRIATAPLLAEIRTIRTYAIKLFALDEMVSGGSYKDAMPAIDAAVESIPEELLPGLLLLKARSQLLAAQNKDDYYDAALSAMRIAIHFPDSAEASGALLLAASAHEAAGNREDAVKLAWECLGKEKLANSVRDKARQMIERLRG